mmetsp:Transcript_62324/g.200959  ORF Transcript_62324/g.200959 Transcript_62324/m.200959 type:complete len:539 (-) Transcript_62324:45-1661(-)
MYDEEAIKYSNCRAKVMKAISPDMHKLCDCASDFQENLKECSGDKSSYGPNIDKQTKHLEDQYSIKCPKCEDEDDRECHCGYAYTPASGEYSQCQTQKVGDRDHFCGCLEEFLEKTEPCKGTSKIGPTLLPQEKRWNETCGDEWKNRDRMKCGTGMEKKTDRPSDCEHKDFEEDPDLEDDDGEALRPQCCQELAKCGKGWAPKGGHDECVGKDFTDSDEKAGVPKDDCCEEEAPDCLEIYVTSSGKYQACNAKADARYATYTKEEQHAFDIGANPHPRCECVKDYSDSVKPCKDDPTWSASINALTRGVNQAKWMSACREPTCEAFFCKAGSHLKDNPEDIKCGVPGFLGPFGGLSPGKACDPEGDQATCCDDGPAPANCLTLVCPGGYQLKTYAAGYHCKGPACDPVEDRDTCCSKAVCDGAAVFDYGSKKDECAAVGEPVWDSATACWKETDCAEYIKCLRIEACKHSKMTDTCSDHLKICHVKRGGTIYSHNTHSKSSSHCSNGDCTHTSESHTSGITHPCDTDANKDAEHVEEC